MSQEELAGFLASAVQPSAPVQALLIAELAESSARTWGGGSGPDVAPFCVAAPAANGVYLKTGGDPAIKAGWNPITIIAPANDWVLTPSQNRK